QAGARFADKTRQAIAFEQLRTQRTHIIVYAGGYFEIFETLQFVQLVLQLPSTVQERLYTWLSEHLAQIQKRESPFRNGASRKEAPHALRYRRPPTPDLMTECETAEA